jgi:hypothetical protein
VICDTEENYKIAREWISNSDSFHRIQVLRCFEHLLVEFISSILGYPWAMSTITEAFFLIKHIKTLYSTLHPLLSKKNSSSSSGSASTSLKFDTLIEQLHNCIHYPVRSRFLSLLLMIESIVRNEGLFLELKLHTQRNAAISNLSSIINSTKFWNSIKLLFNIAKPFIEILYYIESRSFSSSNSSNGSNSVSSSSSSVSSVSNSSSLSLVDISSFWIYLTNSLEMILLSLPDDFASYIINIYNLKLLSNNILSDLSKLALFLHPAFIKGIASNKESFFKSLLKYSCTFIQGYGYNESDCGKLISQMIAYRNTCASNADHDFPNNLDINTFWQSMNSSKDYQTIVNLVGIILDIFPIIQGNGNNTNLPIHGILNNITIYDNFTPEIKSDLTNSQFLSMLETIRIHEYFSR